MIISELKKNFIKPFDIDDKALLNLFSFFLHTAPSIKSVSAIKTDNLKLDRAWSIFSKNFDETQYKIISDNLSIERYLSKYKLGDDSKLDRRAKGFICKKRPSESDCECFLRHLRNAIAHGRVHLKNVGNRKYILFEDLNDSTKKENARILLTQHDMKILKNELLK